MNHSAETLDRLRSGLKGWRHTGQKDQYEARCPVHDDGTASLSVGIKGDKIVMKCHAGCATNDILAAVGLKMADLMPPKPSRSKRGKIVATYDYHSVDGTLLSQAVRFEPKGFSQRKPKPGGGWLWKVDGVKRVPYRLPELAKADHAAPLFVVEGEKDVDRLRSIGLVATCNAAGAGKWTVEHSEYLRGRHVVILPDNDKTGREHAQSVAKSLAGIAASCKVVALPGLPDKGDVSDWLDNGGTIDELMRAVGEAQNASADAVRSEGNPPSESVLQKKLTDCVGATWADLQLTQVLSDPVVWLLRSSQYATAKDSCIRLSTNQLKRPSGIEDASLEQAGKRPPDVVLKSWRSSILDLLLEHKGQREAEPEERRDVVVAEALHNWLSLARVAKDSEDEPDFEHSGYGVAAFKTGDGRIWYRVGDAHESIGHGLNKITHGEIVACAKAAGHTSAQYGKERQRRRAKIATPLGMEQLRKLARIGAG